MNSIEMSAQEAFEFTLIRQQFNGKYRNIALIGQGSSSKVFRCVDKYNKMLAIKVMNLSQQDQSIVNQMRNELRVMQQMECEHVIKMLDFAETNENIFIVLEFCQFNLEEVRQKYFDSKIPEDIAIKILFQLVNGLSYLHKNRIIHRDLKLENIGVVMPYVDLLVITENHFRFATYKLIDLGSSKCLTTNDQTKSQIGNPATRAPEIQKCDLYSVQADIYSLGCCLYKMITGDDPYPQIGIPRLLDAIQSETAQFNLIQNEELRNINQRMLKLNPNERIIFEELDELCTRLQNKYRSYFEQKLTEIKNLITIRDLSLKAFAWINDLKKISESYPQIKNSLQKQQYESQQYFLLDFVKIICSKIENFVMSNNNHPEIQKQRSWLKECEDIRKIQSIKVIKVFNISDSIAFLLSRWQNTKLINQLNESQPVEDLLYCYSQQNIKLFHCIWQVLKNVSNDNRLNQVEVVIALLFNILISLAHARGIAEFKPFSSDVGTKNQEHWCSQAHFSVIE